MNTPTELTGLFFAAPQAAADPIADRLTYASFPRELREAMKIAAQRFGWTREDWRLQTNMIQDAMLGGWYSAGEIATAYAHAPLREAA